MDAASPPADSAALRALIGSEGRHIQPCLDAFLPLLFALAERQQVSDPEDAVYAVLNDLRTCCTCWEKTELPASLWVTGMAVRRFRLRALGEELAAAS